VSQTIKDKRKQRTFQNVWEIVKRQDGSFDLFHNSELSHSSTPERWLEDQLAEHGICGDEYREVLRQIGELGRAKLIY